MEHKFVKALDDEKYVYYKCQNHKAKKCKAIIRYTKLESDALETGHNAQCKLATKRKFDKAANNNNYGYSMEDILMDRSRFETTHIFYSLEEKHDSVSKSELSSIYKNTSDVEASSENQSLMYNIGFESAHLSKTTLESIPNKTSHESI
jgi:hypothetical protein